MTRRLVPLLAVLAIIGTTFSAPAAGTTLTLTPRNGASNALSWTGTVTRPAAGVSVFDEITLDECAVASGATCADGVPAGRDERTYTASLGSARSARVTTWVSWDGPDALDVYVLDEKGNQVRSASAQGDSAILSYDVLNGRRYRVQVVGAGNAATNYSASTWIRRLAGQNYNGPGKLRYPKKDLFATVDIPINIVFAGFDPAEVEANKAKVLEQIPKAFRPVIRIGNSSTGGAGFGLVRRDGGPEARTIAGLPGSAIEYEPIEYRYKPRVIVTPDAWTKQMFAAAKAATTEGDYQLPFDREFIERYNARTGSALRAPNVVAPGQKIDFVDGFKLEDWVAAHPPAGLDFDLRKPANGYTYFVIDSYRPSYAQNYFNLDRYHNFRVMNSLTTDPDSGAQNGFDWGRVWGGRYRFLMLDVGAAPNAWEALQYPTTKIFRVAGNGDSSITDPPIWHYETCTSQACVGTWSDFYSKIGEDAQYAIWMRFTRGYLYRPRAYDFFILAGNTWHDANAYAPYPSRLDKLYKDKLILDRYKELIPYAGWIGVSKYKYLTADDPEQKALDAGKQRTTNGAAVPFGVNTHPMMNLVNRNRATYAPLVAGGFTVPVMNVVFPSLYTFGTPAITGGIAEGEDGEAWGQIQNVNDRTKTYAATGPVTDSKGVRHEPASADARGALIDQVPGGVDNVARFGFTATALHEAGHFFGLSHTHDAVAYDPTLTSSAGDVSKADGYYDTIDWMYTTTASPMGYGWEYNKFEVLDKDNIWIGHALEWLKEAQEALADGYAAFDARRKTSVTAAVASQTSATRALMDKSVAALKGGRYLEAVMTALRAKRAAYGTLATAARAVVARGDIRAASLRGTSQAAGASSVSGSAAITGAPMAEDSTRRPADVPWALLAALAVAAVVTMQAGMKSRPRALRVTVKPPKHRQ